MRDFRIAIVNSLHSDWGKEQGRRLIPFNRGRCKIGGSGWGDDSREFRLRDRLPGSDHLPAMQKSPPHIAPAAVNVSTSTQPPDRGTSLPAKKAQPC